MVIIRLSRTGAKKRPFYHVVAIDSRHARDSGRYIERLGYFNPGAKGAEIKIKLNDERIDYWVANGAQKSDRVDSIIKQNRKDASGAAAGPSKKEKRRAKQAAAKAQAATASEATGETASSET